MNNLLKIILLEERIVLDAAATAVIYVNAHATAGGDGSSWAHAYNNLQDALVKAASTAGPDQIWIAQGTYKPSQIYSPNGVTGGASGLNDPHLETFNLPNNVSIYGGFNGTETSLSQRNPLANVTTLNGDLGGGVEVWHVVTLGNDVAKTGVTATLDGLSIINGDAEGPDAGTPQAIYNQNPLVTYAHDMGGGIYERYGSQLTLNNDIVNNNQAAASITNSIFYQQLGELGGGGLAAMDSGTRLSINHTYFTNDSSGNGPGSVGNVGLAEGGAMVVFWGASASISDSNFIGNDTSARGGAISVRNASMTVLNSLFDHNFTTIPTSYNYDFGHGSAVAIEGSTVSMSNTLFHNNYATTFGTISFENFLDSVGSLTLNNDSYINNTAQLWGGALGTFTQLNANRSSLLISNSLFLGNHAVEGNGGALVLEGISATITNDIFLNNFAQYGGGAIATSNLITSGIGDSLSTVNVLNSNFIGNSTAADSTAIGAVFAQQLITSFGLTEVATAGGGAIANGLDGRLNVSNSLFVNNSSGGNGGAIATGDSNVNVGGFVLWGSSAITTLDNNSYQNNKAKNGGAISSVAMPGDLNVTTFITNSMFTNNDVTSNGGALYLNGVNATITGNKFTPANDAMQGDQIYALNTLITVGLNTYNTNDGNPTPNSNSALVNALVQANKILNLHLSDDLYLN